MTSNPQLTAFYTFYVLFRVVVTDDTDVVVNGCSLKYDTDVDHNKS